MLFGAHESLSQNIFKGIEYKFDDGNCGSVYVDEDSLEYLLLQDTFGICNDKITLILDDSVSGGSTDFVVHTTGVFLTENSNFLIEISSDSFDYLIKISRNINHPDSLELHFVIDGDTIHASNPYTLESDFTDNNFFIFEGGSQPITDFSFSIQSFGFTNINGYSEFFIRFGETLIPEGFSVSASDKYFFRLSVNPMSVNNVSITYNGMQYPLGLFEIYSHVIPLSINELLDTFQLNDTIFLSGSGLQFVEDIRYDYFHLDYELISDSSLIIYTPQFPIFTDNNKLYFESPLNVIVMENVGIAQPMKPAKFHKFPGVLSEDNEKAIRISIYDQEESPSPYKLKIKDAGTNNLIDSLYLFHSDTIIWNLPFIDTFNLSLYKIDPSTNDYILTDQTSAYHINGSGIYLTNELEKILEIWTEADTIDLVDMLINSDIDPFESRVFLQSLNNGSGFDDSENPWYSNSGLFISARLGLNGSVTPPDTLVIPDIPCSCEYKTTMLHYINPNVNAIPIEPDFGYWPTSKNKHVTEDKSGERIWLRTQRTGAATYREAYTYRKYNAIAFQALNIVGEQRNIAGGEASAGKGKTELSVVKYCFKRENRRLRPCNEVCDVPSTFFYGYNSIIYNVRTYNASFWTNFTEVYSSDAVYAYVQEGENGDKNLLNAALLDVRFDCKSSWNPDFWTRFLRFGLGIAGIIFGSEFDISNITELTGILDQFDDLINTSFLNRSGCSTNTTTIDEGNRLDGAYQFVLEHGKRVTFVIENEQSFRHRVLRSGVNTKIISDVYIALVTGNEEYARSEWNDQRDSCCQFTRGAYIIGSHDTLWLDANISNDPKPIPDTLTQYVARTYSGLRSNELVSKFNPYSLIPSGGFDPALNYDSRLEDDFFCNPFGDLMVVDENIPEISFPDEHKREPGVRIFPNPSHGQINIHFNEYWDADKAVDILITNQLGQPFKYERYKVPGLWQMDLSVGQNLTPGWYILTIVQGDSRIVKPLFIQKN